MVKVSLDRVRDEAAGCTRCPLYKDATQTVFGEGTASARVMLVGEQPGDREDLAGSPFVGPAGQLLDKALAESGLDREGAYVTNVVKHFKWKRGGRSGKVRLHQKPNTEEIDACSHWLHLELDAVQPQVVVALGATAAQALLGKSFRVTKQRAEWAEWDRAPRIMATVHPSSVLRAPDDARRRAYEDFVADLEVAARAVESSR